jgi:hypothetical protein
MVFKLPVLSWPNSKNCEYSFPKTNMLIQAHIFPFLDLYPTSHPAEWVQVPQKAWNLLSVDVKVILRNAESNLDALNTVESSQVNTLPIAKSQTRSKQNKGIHKSSSVYNERGVLLPVLKSGGEWVGVRACKMPPASHQVSATYSNF